MHPAPDRNLKFVHPIALCDKLCSRGFGWSFRVERQPDTRYAKSGDVHVAYQVFGEGAIDLVFVPGFISNVEVYWEDPSHARWLRRLGRFARVISFDKRGTGLSDRVSTMPAMDQRMDDVRAVLDAAASQSAAILGVSEGGSLAVLFAATHPERCRALILYGAFAQFSDWFPTKEKLEAFFQYAETKWGTGDNLPVWAPSRKDDKAFKSWFARRERLGASPAAVIELMKMNSEIDIRGILPAIRVPTLVMHRTADRAVSVEGSRALARHIPNARLLELPGEDHLPYLGEDSDRIVDEIEQFLTGTRAVIEPDRVLATVMFTDIVGSTRHASELGDRRWREVLDQHDEIVRREIARFRGREVKTLGDGFLATFDGPARAVRCAKSISDVVRPLGVEVRSGVHTGEIEMKGDDVAGLAVHIAARVAAAASAGQVLVSSTVRDLVAGSGLTPSRTRDFMP
jgi:pimeloyl-ACP methyl ester carboxylesterase